MKALSFTQSRLAVASMCLAAVAVLWTAGGRVRDRIAAPQPTVHLSADFHVKSPSREQSLGDAQRPIVWADSRRVPTHTVRASSLSAADDLQRLYALPDAESPPSDVSIASLLSLLDEDPKVRLDAVTALTIVGGDLTLAALTSTALSDIDAKVREEAVYALGEIGTEGCIEVLKHALFDPDVGVREAAVDALADIGGEQSAVALAPALKDAHASLRAEVVDALGEIGGPIAIRLLQQALMDPQSSVREEAADLLAELSEIGKDH